MFGLLGKSLSHSHSPEIHRLLGNNDYRLFETDDPKSFLVSNAFSGLNITIPYKESIIPLLDELDPVAASIGAVNTIVRKDNRLVGYNTDAYGFDQLLRYKKIDVSQRNILILGNGGASKACEYVLKNRGAKKVVKLCRHIKTKNEYLFSEINKVVDSEIIINTTPVGMYPKNEQALPVDFDLFPGLVSVVDLIYNPLHTNFLLSAKSRGVSTANGLYMLVAQAAKANELFTGVPATENQIVSVFSKLSAKLSNIVLIGLPGSGKSTVASLLAPDLKKTFVDCDGLIADAAGMSVSDIFSSFGESYFRSLEYELVQGLYQSQGLLISTGGGMVENERLMNLLRQNGVIVFLDRSLDFLLNENISGRPLLRTQDDLVALAKKRLALYKKYADIRHESAQSDPALEAAIVKEKLYEYFDNQRS